MNTEWSGGLREMNDMTLLCLFRNNCVYFWWAFCNSNNVILSQNLSVWVAKFHQNIIVHCPDECTSAVKNPHKVFSQWTRMWADFLTFSGICMVCSFPEQYACLKNCCATDVHWKIISNSFMAYWALAAELQTCSRQTCRCPVLEGKLFLQVLLQNERNFLLCLQDRFSFGLGFLIAS